MFRCVSAVFDQLGTQWQLCTETDTSDGDHGSMAVFLQMVGNALSEPVAFALRVVAEDGDKVSRPRPLRTGSWRDAANPSTGPPPLALADARDALWC